MVALCLTLVVADGVRLESDFFSLFLCFWQTQTTAMVTATAAKARRSSSTQTKTTGTFLLLRSFF